MKMAILAVVALFAVTFASGGCSGGEKEVVETPESTQAAQQSASVWTEDQKAAMKKALSQRRTGGK